MKKKKQVNLKVKPRVKPNPLWWNIFIDEYIRNGQKAGPAYRKAHPKVKANSADTEACKLLRNAKFAKVLEAAQNKTKKSLDMTYESWLKELRSIGEKKNLKVNAMAKLKSLEILGKSLGYLSEKLNVEHHGSIEVIDPYAKKENDDNS